MAKQERAVRTRQIILDAAASVFDELGYEAAGIAQILDRAGVTKGALSFHYPSKEALAQGVIDAQTQSLSLPRSPSGLQLAIDTCHYVARELQCKPLLRASIRLTIEQG